MNEQNNSGPYILNLVLGCYVAGNSGKVCRGFGAFKNLNELCSHWNDHPNMWKSIHYPCRPEHFELRETLYE